MNGSKVYAYREDGSVLVYNVSAGVVQGDLDLADRITTTLDSNGNVDTWNYYRAYNEDRETYDRNGRLL